MSDNLPPEVVQEKLEAWLRIPTEVWTDVFKLLPRRVLVQQIAPVCYCFKEITNKNVKNVHVIENANQFTEKLNMGYPEANQQLEQLAGSSCQLASQFRLANLWISEKSKAILNHCPDLFNGCQIGLYFNEQNKDSTFFLECLSHLEKAEPIVISASQRVDQVIDFWHHPTFQNCTRVSLTFWMDLSAAAVMNISDWLHHQPNGVDCDGSADDQQVRCMIVWRTGHNEIDWLLNRCSEDIQQAQQPIDRRQYVLSFYCLDWPGFDQFRRIENKSTGEVLTLERKMLVDGQATHCYRLRRCLTEEEANGAEFYKGMFEQDLVFDKFNFGNEKPAVVTII